MLKKKFLKKKFDFFSLRHPPTTHECSQKMSAQSVPLGLVLLYRYNHTLYPIGYRECTLIFKLIDP